MADISVKQKEEKTVTFTITQNSQALDVSGGEYKFAVKQSKDDAAYLIEKDHSDFDDTNASSGILRVTLTENDLDMDPGEYVAELKVDLNPSSSGGSGGIDKSADLSMEVLQAVITD